jgi:uncharacterized protein
MSDDPHILATPEALRGHYGEPPELVIRKVLPAIDRYGQRFIAASPFIILSTANAEGQCNATPRGDPPGFVHVPDRHTLLIPDRRGNNRVDAMMDIVRNPHAGVLFIVPGITETLRVNGRAEITVDPAVLDRLAADGKPARAAIRVTVESAFFQCGKAMIRSELWNPERQRPKTAFEPFGKVLSEQVRIDYDPALEDFIAEEYRSGLY